MRAPGEISDIVMSKCHNDKNMNVNKNQADCGPTAPREMCLVAWRDCELKIDWRSWVVPPVRAGCSVLHSTVLSGFDGMVDTSVRGIESRMVFGQPEKTGKIDAAVAAHDDPFRFQQPALQQMAH